MVWAKVDFVLPFDDDIQKQVDAISQDLAAGTITEDEAATRMNALIETVDAKVQVIEQGQLSLF
jgi:hypothetical protein